MHKMRSHSHKKRSSSQTPPLDHFILSLNKYIDNNTTTTIVKTLGKQYADAVRLYKFPIDVCRDLKAYDVLEQNKSEKTQKLLKQIRDDGDAMPPFFDHETTFALNKLFSPPGKRKPKSGPSVSFEQEIDFNSLAIISHKLAERFAKDSHDFETGSLSDTELIEFHTYMMTGIKTKRGTFSHHIDDQTGVSYNTITVIWYLIKDKSVKGGNISFFSDFTDEPADAISLTRKEVTINLWDQSEDNLNCACLLFKGNVEHMPEMMGGTGERSAIVYHFIRIDKSVPQGGNKSIKKRKGKKRNTSKKQKHK